MENLTRLTYIKSLLIFQSPIVYEKIEKYVLDAKQMGVSIGDLAINPYVYSTRSFDVSFLVNYIQSLDNVIRVFRNIYDDYLYELRLHGNIDNNYKDNFHVIFNAVNNTFNLYLDDRYLFEDFSIYHSETSLGVIMLMYDAFNEHFIFYMKNNVDSRVLKSLIQRKNLKYLPYIYDNIFEQYEYIYLPFY